MRIICNWLKRINPFKKKDTILKVFADRRRLSEQKPYMDPTLYDQKLKKLDERYNALLKEHSDNQ
jgi:hypothetical protein